MKRIGQVTTVLLAPFALTPLTLLALFALNPLTPLTLLALLDRRRG
jgi:hypothetical protein